MVWGCIGGNAGAVLECDGGERAELQDKALGFVYVPSLTYGHELWGVTLKGVGNTSGQNEIPRERSSAQPQRYVEEIRYLGGGWRRKAKRS